MTNSITYTSTHLNQLPYTSIISINYLCINKLKQLPIYLNQLDIHIHTNPTTKHIASGIQPENQNGHQQDNISNTTITKYLYIYTHKSTNYIPKSTIYTYIFLLINYLYI